jgi:hypothetical protein
MSVASTNIMATVIQSSQFNKFYKPTNLSITNLSLDHNVEKFLCENIDVALIIPDLISITQETIKRHIVPTLKIIEDEESTDIKCLAIIFNIKDESYENILKIWDEVVKNVYNRLNIQTSKKVSIILEGG